MKTLKISKIWLLLIFIWGINLVCNPVLMSSERLVGLENLQELDLVFNFQGELTDKTQEILITQLVEDTSEVLFSIFPSGIPQENAASYLQINCLAIADIANEPRLDILTVDIQLIRILMIKPGLRVRHLAFQQQTVIVGPPEQIFSEFSDYVNLQVSQLKSMMN